MSGTISGLGLSQRVDANGKPDRAWLLYLYSANSSTPVTSYKDVALTAGLENPWPLEADSNGMMPIFWLADGSYRVRGTSADGSRSFFDLPTVLALGASAGSTPSGGVDPNAIANVGDVMWQPVSGTRAGWVRDNGRTIGSATSGASERANADCQALFLYGWAQEAAGNIEWAGAVVGGAGVSAAADWGADKQLTLPDMRGYVPGGLDDMGNSAAGRFAGVPVVSGAVTTAGSVLGEAAHELILAEAPNGQYSINNPSHTHFVANSATFTGGISAANHVAANADYSGGSSFNYTFGGTNSAANVGLSSSEQTGIILTDNAGGGSHNTVQKTILGTFYRKL